MNHNTRTLYLRGQENQRSNSWHRAI